MILLVIGVTCAIMTAKQEHNCLNELTSALDFFIPTLVWADITPERMRRLRWSGQTYPSSPQHLLFHHTFEERNEVSSRLADV